ncbi:hypothetical protein CSB45_10040 [candidate division KSB3 bacterium]|uniref:Uncharacterized protein n=1 Tax=candidate division KSB3 bacterium TaxID=2044937 RepID=A0A2G6E4U4_9BACT|nr:MAG: hypothetical protein CSB45_10040 [candidate division KSB3 bacterium]PIE29345.1 MAG: hypothetical protein CSA57_09055 [candidate division KSB3 bacterium]
MSSMKEVAKMANVSVSTVSRVINQSAQVDRETSRRVEDAIQALDYRPNLLARGLRQHGNQHGDFPRSLYAVYERYREHAESGTAYPGSPGMGKKLGFASSYGAQPFCITVEQGLLRQAQLAGFHENDLIILDNQYDAATGLKNAEIMLSKEPDIFIEHQADIKINSMIAAQFADAGIPIIAVDTPVPGSPFMGCHDWQAAMLGGEHMACLIETLWGGWDAVDHVVLLQNPVGGEMSMLRSEGFATALAQKFGERVEEKIVRANGGTGGAEQSKSAMDDILARYPTSKKFAVTSLNEESMSGVIVSLQHAGIWNPDNIIIITLGVDNLGKLQIRKGLSNAGVTFFPEKYGEYLIPAACAILQGSPVPSHMYVEHRIISRENIDTVYPLI